MFLSNVMRPIRVANRFVGPGHPTLIVAELGYNFNTADEALQSVDAAAAAGAEAIKLQTFQADTLAAREVRFPAEAGGGDQYEEFKRYEISEEVHHLVFEHARRRGLIPFSTPSHPDDADLLERLRVPVLKIGSDDLTNLPLLRHIAGKRLPVILSSGMATLAEVDCAVQTLRAAGCADLVLLHCVSNYPVTDASTLNLRAITTLAAAFQVPVGFSDHTLGISAAVAAVALGAAVIERHFVLDHRLPVPDAGVSADPAEFARLVQAIREVEQMLGDGAKRPAASELDMRRDTRKSLFARRDLKAGHRLEAGDVVVKRPSWGIPPADLDVVIGRVLRRDVHADEPLQWAVL